MHNGEEAVSDDPRYVLREEIGAGGMGRVYKAEDTLYGGYVAIKVIKRDSVTDDEFLIKSLKKEAQLQAKLCRPEKHPNIVALTDLRTIGDGIGVVMELVDGPSLHKRMGPRNKPNEISLAEFFDFMSQTCCGLQFAHDRKVIHRDIKPANLMINSDGKVKIVDWGVAKNVQAAGPSISFAGTVPYLPPEVVQLERMSREERVRNTGVDHRADLYSLGVTMYQILTRELPFDRNEIETGVRDRHWRLLEKHAKRALVEIVLKAMAVRPEDRYQSANELQHALQAFQFNNLFEDDLEEAKAAEAKAVKAKADQAKAEEAASENEKAEDAFRRLPVDYPAQPKPYYEAAGYFVRQCREDVAIEVLSKGIQILPQAGELYEFRGRLYAKRLSPEAEQDLKKALELLPRDESHAMQRRQLQRMLDRLTGKKGS